MCRRAPTCSASSDVPRDDRLFGHGRPAGAARAAPDTSPSCIWAPAVSRGSSACWAIDAVERLHVLQRTAHQQRVGDAVAVVGEHPHRARRTSAIAPSSASRSPAQPDGDRADRLHVDQAGLAAEPAHLLDHAGGVRDRVGVRHRAHRGVAAERGGLRAGDRPSRHPPGRVRAGGCAGRRGRAARSGRSPSMTVGVRRQRVIAATTPSSTAAVARSADRPAAPPTDRSRVCGDHRHCHDRSASPPSSWYSTAIRTDTPLATCSTIVDRGESATSAAISMPRFIGPGVHDDRVLGTERRRRRASSPYPRRSTPVRTGRSAAAASARAAPAASSPTSEAGQRRIQVVADLGTATSRRRPAAASAARPASPSRRAYAAAARSIGPPGCAARRRRSRRRSPARSARAGDRIVYASSSAWVGCSCVPSPALITLPSDPAGQPVRRPGRGVPDHHRVGAHRLRGSARCP